MAANIKIGANSSEFQKQMKQMTQELKKVSSSYNLANTQAKLFGKGTDLLKSRQAELTSKIKIQNRMIEAQEEHFKKLNSDLEKQKDKQKELANKIEETSKKYKESVEATGKSSKESKELAKELKELKEDYTKNDRAIESNISKLNNAEIKLNNNRKALMENEKALKDINKELEKSKLEKFGESCGKLGEKANNLGDKLTMGLTLPIAAAGTASFKLASDLNENINKTDVVFEGNAKVVEDWSKTSLEKMGMCQSSALEMASKYGDMGKSMGLNSTQVKDYSMNLTQLAGDLASFKNISIERANEALTGVYTGETEALKGLGIVMTQANLQAFALATGFKKTNKNSVEAQKAALNYEKAEKNLSQAIKKHGKDSIQAREAQLRLKEAQEKMTKATQGQKMELTQAEQVQLRYNYIMAKTKDAQGDFSRTGDQAANATRKFGEATKQLGATIGEKLIPIFTPWINKANDLIQKFAGMSSGTQNLIVSLGLIGVASGPILKVTGNMLSLTKNTIESIGKIKDFAKATKEGTSGLAKFGKGIVKGTKSIGTFSKKLITTTGNGLAKFGKGIFNVTKSLGKFTLELIKSAGKGLATLGKGLLKGIKTMASFTKAIILNTASAIKNGAIWVANKAKMLAFKTAQLAVTAATKGMTIAQKALNLAMRMNPIGLVITILLSLAAVFITLYNKCDWFRNGVNKVWSGIKHTFSSFANFFKGAFKRDWTQTLGILGVPINAFFGTIKSIIGGVKGVFNGLIRFFKGVFTGNWRMAFQGLANVVKSIFGTMGAIIKSPINAAISGINMAIRGVNKLSFDIPDWVPGLGGKHFGVHIPQIPALAEGGIVTKATMALVGEGKEHEAVIPLSKLDSLVTNSVKKVIGSGNTNNIEAIADRIVEKLIIALSQVEHISNIKIDGRRLARIIAPLVNEELARI